MTLRLLKADLQAKLRSDVAVCSISHAVQELVDNAIDAKANRIGIRVDFQLHRFSVVDDGTGIEKEDLEKIGQR